MDVDGEAVGVVGERVALVVEAVVDAGVLVDAPRDRQAAAEAVVLRLAVARGHHHGVLPGGVLVVRVLVDAEELLFARHLEHAREVARRKVGSCH
ncbi:MAG: hypothetical protein GTN49_04985 [candidate division Zixibacteria bacterium]|nr:hypothetical protein [candidate division Zixibacteria bacterium]